MIRILLVESEPRLRRALLANLRARGYEVEPVATGREALQQALVETPDGAVLDVGVCDLAAAELVRLLRAWMVGPIILTAAPDQEPDRVAALNAGADGHVTKPFGVTELLSLLRAALPGESREEDVPAL